MGSYCLFLDLSMQGLVLAAGKKSNTKVPWMILTEKIASAGKVDWLDLIDWGPKGLLSF